MRDALNGQQTQSSVAVVAQSGVEAYDIVLVAIRRDQLRSTLGHLQLAGRPAIVLFGNNPDGRSVSPVHLSGEVRGGLPGHGVAEYVRIPQQPTSFESGTDSRLNALEVVLRGQQFAVQRILDMDGWLAFHAVFVSCIAAALYRCETVPVRLADDRQTLSLMCRAITEGFGALRSQGVRGLPRNLAILHSPLLYWFAERYWSRTMRSRMGELGFGAHARHAETEMRLLANDVLAKTGDRPGTTRLRLPLKRA